MTQLDRNEESSLDEVARAACQRYGVGADCSIQLLNFSENATYLVTDPGTGVHRVLRIHRAGYSLPQEIASELAWMTALRDESGVRTPRALPAVDGALVIQTPTEPSGTSRSCVMFEYLLGEAPSEDNLTEAFEQLGEVAARMHRHAESWTPPLGFTRRTWDLDTTIGERPHWGSWRDGPVLDAATEHLLDRVATVLRSRLDDYGKSPGRFGLVHADMRLANLLLHDGSCSVIDFDDSGYSWYLWDLATALTFIEDRPDVPQLVHLWLRGYEALRPLDSDDRQHIPDLIMLRRLLVLAWIGSHADTALAQAEGERYACVTRELAERYLRDPLRPIAGLGR